MKRVLGLIVSVMMLFLVVGCKDGDSPGKTNAPSGSPENTQSSEINVTANVIMTINGYEISEDVYKLMLYEEAERFRLETDPQEELDEEEYAEWYAGFFDTEIDGKSVVDIIKERTLTPLKEYAYFMKEVRNKGIVFDSSEIIDIETEEIILLGDEYNSDDPDEYFIYKYGVTKRQYLDFSISQRLIEAYLDREGPNQEIGNQQIEEYKELYGDYYAIKTLRSVFLSVKSETELNIKTVIANEVLAKIKQGVDIKALVAEYSEDDSSSEGLFVVSSEENDYPHDIIEWVMSAKIGDSGIVSSYDGIYIIKCEEVKFDENEIKKDIGREIIIDFVEIEINKSEYEPKFDMEVYSKYIKLPGDLMPEGLQ